MQCLQSLYTPWQTLVIRQALLNLQTTHYDCKAFLLKHSCAHVTQRVCGSLLIKGTQTKYSKFCCQTVSSSYQHICLLHWERFTPNSIPYCLKPQRSSSHDRQLLCIATLRLCGFNPCDLRHLTFPNGCSCCCGLAFSAPRRHPAPSILTAT